MKHKLFLRFASSTLMMLVIMVSCSKQGPAGATGPAGPAGPKGDTGNANVIVSPWTSNPVDAYDRWAVAAITQGVMDSSVVLVYMKDLIDDVYLLPYTNPYDNSYVYDHLIVGYIIFISSSAIFFSNDSFRYVIVPAAMVATGIPQSYKEMTAKLGIAP